VEAIKRKRWRDLVLTPRQRALCTVAEKLSATPTRMVDGLGLQLDPATTAAATGGPPLTRPG
jgi:hypothetical protein